MDEDKNFGVRIPAVLFAQLQVAAKELGYANTSEATRDAIRDLIERAEERKRSMVKRSDTAKWTRWYLEKAARKGQDLDQFIDNWTPEYVPGTTRDDLVAMYALMQREGSIPPMDYKPATPEGLYT